MREFKLYPALLFATGVALGIPLNMIGSLLAGEFILGIFALGGLLANFHNPGFLDRRLVIFTSLFSLALCVYIATDFLSETALQNAARGWARFIFLIVDFIGFYVIGRKSRFKLFPLLLGYMTGQIFIWLRPGTDPHWYITAWKYHLCIPILIGALCLFRSAAFSIALLIVAGVSSFRLDTRAFGAMCFMTAALLVARIVAVRRTRRLMPAVLLLALAASALGVNAILAQTHDRFGQRQMGSNEMRYAAFLTAFQTIRMRPWVGAGSWKTDFEAANRHRANLLQAGGTTDVESDDQSGHSQILQTWLEGGPLAALAFFYMLWRMLAALYWTLQRPVDKFLGFAIFVLLNGIWSCLFSPFLGADIRVNAAVSIYVCIVLARERKNLIRAHA